MANDTEDPGIVRDPADVRREQAARQPDFAAQERDQLEEYASQITAQLIRDGQHHQTVNNDNEFAARFDISRMSVDRKVLTERVEELLREKLGDNVDLIVKLYDMRSPYVGFMEGVDITIWATPKKS